MIRNLFTIIFSILSLALSAQGNIQAEGADGFMRSNLKIYVVVAVLTIILSGIFIFLLLLQNRIKQLETKQS